MKLSGAHLCGDNVVSYKGRLPRKKLNLVYLCCTVEQIIRKQKRTIDGVHDQVQRMEPLEIRDILLSDLVQIVTTVKEDWRKLLNIDDDIQDKKVISITDEQEG